MLFLYQYSFFQRCLTRCRLNTLALRTFVKKFQGPYKHGVNGTVDYRWFAGLYFILHIIAFFISFGGLSTYIIVSAFVYLFTAVFFALLQPYNKQIYNITDSAILASVYILLIVHVGLISLTGHPSTVIFVFIQT